MAGSRGVLPGLPGGRGGWSRGQQPVQAGGSEHGGGYGPGRQPGADRSQQLALRHHLAGHTEGLSGRGGAQTRQPQPVRNRRPYVRPDGRNAQRHKRGGAPR
jgi:hypothetical protein